MEDGVVVDSRGVEADSRDVEAGSRGVVIDAGDAVADARDVAVDAEGVAVDGIQVSVVDGGGAGGEEEAGRGDPACALVNAFDGCVVAVVVGDTDVAGDRATAIATVAAGEATPAIAAAEAPAVSLLTPLSSPPSPLPSLPPPVAVAEGSADTLRGCLVGGLR